MKKLDEKLLETMTEYIKTYSHDNNGRAPGLYDIIDALGLEKTKAYRYMKVLGERGIVEYSGKGTLKMTGGEYVKESRFVKVPIYGSVICGTPEEEEQHNEGYLALPAEWVSGCECFLLIAKGDSMKDAGVDAGDLVLVRKESDAHDGQVVVALTEDGNTLKRYKENGGRPVLMAENSEWDEKKRKIVPKSLSIQGVAMKVIKDIV